MSFTDEQIKELNKKLNPSNVQPAKPSGPKGDYIEGWFAEQTANEIFGFDGWSSEVVELIENTEPTKNHNQNWVVSFRAKVRVTVGDVVKEGIGFGSGISKDIHDAYEGAIKESETDAEKRAFKKFGNRFGLALYDKTRANVGVDVDWGQERDELTRMLQGCQNIDDLVELWQTERMQKFVKYAPQEFSSAIIQIKDKQKATIQQLGEAA